ncbi:hypothetical protein CAPTEDRAFT_200004, partial [Capitella teleta]
MVCTPSTDKRCSDKVSVPPRQTYDDRFIVIYAVMRMAKGYNVWIVTNDKYRDLEKEDEDRLIGKRSQVLQQIKDPRPIILDYMDITEWFMLRLAEEEGGVIVSNNEFRTERKLKHRYIQGENTVGFTYNNEATGAQSVLDHFIVSENLFGSIESYSCLHEGDNLSDHLTVCLNLDVKVSFAPQSNAYALNRPSWQRATVQDKAAYQLRLKELLREVDIPFDVFSCRPFECVCEDHGRMIEQYYSDVMSAMIRASKECIPSRSKKKAAGWSTYVSHHQEESIFWHKIWLSSGRPRTGWVQDIRKKTRAQYKRISRWVLRNQGKLSADRMAQALSENNSRDLWREVKKLKGGSYAQPRVVDEVEGAKDVCELFRQKYEDLYSSVSFNEHEMNALLNDVSCNVDVCCKTGKCKNHHVMHVNDVQYAVNKLKP